MSTAFCILYLNTSYLRLNILPISNLTVCICLIFEQTKFRIRFCFYDTNIRRSNLYHGSICFHFCKFCLLDSFKNVSISLKV